jgi:hypothetical protein
MNFLVSHLPEGEVKRGSKLAEKVTTLGVTGLSDYRRLASQ